MRNCRLNLASGAGPTLAQRSSRGAPGRPTADRGPEGTSGALVGSVGHSLTRRIKFSTPEAPESFPDPVLGPQISTWAGTGPTSNGSARYFVENPQKKSANPAVATRAARKKRGPPNLGGNGFYKNLNFYPSPPIPCTRLRRVGGIGRRPPNSTGLSSQNWQN